jgi:hypothetical protein
MLPKKLGIEFAERRGHGYLLNWDAETAMMPQKTDGFKPPARV